MTDPTKLRAVIEALGDWTRISGRRRIAQACDAFLADTGEGEERCKATVDAGGPFDTPHPCDRPLPCPFHSPPPLPSGEIPEGIEDAIREMLNLDDRDSASVYHRRADALRAAILVALAEREREFDMRDTAWRKYVATQDGQLAALRKQLEEKKDA